MQQKIDEIQIRDPFIVASPGEKCYRLYRSSDDGRGVDFYRSSDLLNFAGPFPCFRLPQCPEFAGITQVWAPEVHCYHGMWYLFVTLGAETQSMRRTWIFRSDSPEGPFKQFTSSAPTPENWMCLDGTLYVAEDDTPYLVYCHEWVQCSDGEIWAAELKKDFTGTTGHHILLCCGSQAAWLTQNTPPIIAPSGFPRYITDGPFLWREETTGKLLMLWSTFDGDNYTVGIAESSNGKIDGEWRQHSQPLFAGNGGHAMTFRDFSGQRMLALHCPNCGVPERLHMLPMPEM